MTTPYRVGDPRRPLDPDQVRNLSAKLSPKEIARAEPDIDYLGIMDDPEARTSAAIFDACVGSLSMLGYGRTWLARALGVDERSLRTRRGRVRPYMMRHVLTAAIRIGSRWATPESTGQTAEQIEAVRRRAASRGCRVPAAYDNRYTPVDAALSEPGDKKPVRDPGDVAAAKIQMLAHFCAHGGTEIDLAHRFHLSTRTVGRARKEETGLRVVMRDRHPMTAEGQGDLVAAIFKASNEIHTEDPVEVWKRLRAFAAERMAGQETSEEAAEASAAA